jgi:uncharacterized protein (TIGR03435 family)
VLLVHTTTALYSQSTRFEVASFKRVDPGELQRLAAAEQSGQGIRVGWWGGPGTSDPERFTAQYVSLVPLISRAYDLKPYQFTPLEWMGVERYTLNARLAPGVSEEQFRLMLQNLLAERLDLKAHWETKEMPVYELVAANRGTKFEDATGKPRPAARVPEGYPTLKPGEETAVAAAGGRVVRRARGETLEATAAVLSAYLKRPVIDATGLNGKYDFTLYWVQNLGMLPSDAEPGPSLPEALHEQLGLKFEPKDRGPFAFSLLTTQRKFHARTDFFLVEKQGRAFAPKPNFA